MNTSVSIVNASSSGLTNLSTSNTIEGTLVLAIIAITIFLIGVAYSYSKTFRKFVNSIIKFISDYSIGGFVISIFAAIMVGIGLMFLDQTTYQNITKPITGIVLGLIDAVLIASVIGYSVTKLGINVKGVTLSDDKKQGGTA